MAGIGSEVTQFKPGNRLGGRPKGSKNKIRHDVAAILDTLKCNPFVILAQISLGNIDFNNGKPITATLRKDAASELCNYIAPKLKAIEISTDEAVEQFQLVFNMSKNEHDNLQREQNSDTVSP